MNVVGTALKELYRIFDIFNHDKFNDSLPQPVITIQRGKGRTLGYFTLDKVWKSNQDNGEVDNETENLGYYEINIDPRWFNERTAEEVAETLLHEMCHYKNKLEDIKDCNGQSHNKRFKVLAESVGLVVEKCKGVGWGHTSMSDELKDYIVDIVNPNKKCFEYFRSAPIKHPKERVKKIFKYNCPNCDTTAKAKADVQIKCGNCNVSIEMEEE